jgi:hypothetical protein
VANVILDEEEESDYRQRTLNWFTNEPHPQDNTYYCRTVRNSRQFEYVVGSVAHGLSFQQIAKQATLTKRLFGCGTLGDIESTAGRTG